jgi:tetratricopeptide (TPR) repeat protein
MFFIVHLCRQITLPIVAWWTPLLLIIPIGFLYFRSHHGVPSTGTPALKTLQQRRAKEDGDLSLQVVETRKKVLGLEHPDTLSSMLSLASIYLVQGRLGEAEKLFVEITEIGKKVLGSEHPNTLRSMNGLASTYLAQGQLEKAEKSFMEVAEIGEKVLGSEHPDTLLSMHSLASTHLAQGRLDEAEKSFMEVTRIEKEVLGPEHPNTLWSIHGLASTHLAQGRLEEAEKSFIQVTEVRKEVLGPEHPNTLSSMSSLASIYLAQGRPGEAEKSFMEVTNIRKKVLGPEHPDTLNSIDSLALIFVEQGRLEEAEISFTQVTKIRKETIGSKHPDTLRSMEGLALIFIEQGRLDEAEKSWMEVTETRKEMLGLEHPDTLRSMHSLASTYLRQGRLEEAEKSFMEIAEIRKKILGPGYQHKLSGIHGLISTYLAQGRLDRAEELFMQAVEIKKDSHLSSHLSSHETRVYTIEIRYAPGKSIEVMVEPSSFVEDIKDWVANAVGISSRKQILLYGGKQLEDGRTLSDYNISSKATMDLTTRCAPSLYVHRASVDVRLPDGRKRSFGLYPSMTINELKASIASTEGEVSSSYRLLLDGKVVPLAQGQQALTTVQGYHAHIAVEAELISTRPYQIFVQTPETRLPVDVIYSDSFGQVRSLALAKCQTGGIRLCYEDLDEETLQFEFLGAPRPDSELLVDAHADSDSILYLFGGFYSHLLPRKVAILKGGDWKSLIGDLPELLRWDVEYNSSDWRSESWTCTPSSPDGVDDIPLLIAGAPVILPVAYRWPPTSGVFPPPDPHPHILDPAEPLALRTIKDIFKTYPECSGFYLLLNGMLQLIVPDGFDAEWASSHLPNRFGRLRISYIFQSMSPTMNTGVETTQIDTAQQDEPIRSLSDAATPYHSQQRTNPIPTHSLKLNQTIEARAKDSPSKEKFAGRLGLRTTKGSKTYLTISSHVITSMLSPKKRPTSILSWLRGPSNQLKENWPDDVEIWATNKRVCCTFPLQLDVTLTSHLSKVGKIAQTFDPKAKDYPVGFEHDISLVEPFDPSVCSGVKSRVTNLGWLSQEGWNSLRQQTKPMHVLDQNHDAKSMQSNLPSQCLVCVHRKAGRLSVYGTDIRADRWGRDFPKPAKSSRL